METQVRNRNRARTGVWIGILLALAVLIAVAVSVKIGQYYEVGFYMAVHAVTTVVTAGFVGLWWWLAASELAPVGWRARIARKPASSALFFILIITIIAVASFVICPAVYTSDERNHYYLSAAFAFPAVVAMLMYIWPPLEIEMVILPGGGLGQKAARWILALLCFLFAAGLLIYNFW